MSPSNPLCRLILITLLILTSATSAWCLSGKQIEKLHRAGIKGQLLQAIIREKTIETQSLTVDELVALKKSGISNGQLQALVVEKSFMRNRGAVRYGEDLRSIKSLTMQDIERLKANGVSDEIIRDLIVASTRNADEDQRRHAWRMLDNLHLWVR